MTNSQEITVTKLIAITPEAEKMMVYCARVSSKNQESPELSKLIKYCLDHKHWSIFETASMTVEIETSRAISAQILRHRSFTFQEFSQRYAEATEYVTYEARRQDKKNRQNSIADMKLDDEKWFWEAQQMVQSNCDRLYRQALKRGIAKEQARFLLPMSTKTKLYMTGNIRNWLHYIELRSHIDTQLEHRIIAEEIKDIFIEQLPLLAEALEWKKSE